jgi:hypothetical protein
MVLYLLRMLFIQIIVLVFRIRKEFRKVMDKTQYNHNLSILKKELYRKGNNF